MAMQAVYTNSADCGNAVVVLEPLHPGSDDDGDDNTIEATQNTTIDKKDGEDDISTSKAAFSSSHHENQSDTKESSAETTQANSRRDDDIEKRISTLEVLPSSGDRAVTLGSEGNITATTQATISNDSSIDTTVALSTNSHDSGVEDGYSSDDSQASHDSFISTIFRKDCWPPKPYYPPVGYIFLPSKVEDKPSSPGKMRGVQKMALCSTLENLPAELNIQILSSMPDLETLRSITHASPTMHAQYIYARHKILSTCLDRELDGFYVDAYANLKSRPIDLGWGRSNEVITGFLDSYHGWLADSKSYTCAKSLPPSRVRWMAAYHLSVARPLVRRYGSWALKNLEKVGLPSVAQTNIARSSHDIELSRSEEIRIFRALYRHETFHHLFGQNMGSRGGDFEGKDIDEIFFGLFHPWEIEAIGCFDIFLRQQWGDIFDKVKDDIDPGVINVRYCKDIFTRGGRYHMYKTRRHYQDGMISRGLRMIARFLAINDHQDLVSGMERCLIDPSGDDESLVESLNFESQIHMRDLSPDAPDARDEAELGLDQMSFAGDSLSPDGPPLAWVALWSGKYVNLHGQFTPAPPKQWGYVMWDARRWAGVGEKGLQELFAKEWKLEPQAIRHIKFYTDWSPLDVAGMGLIQKVAGRVPIAGVRSTPPPPPPPPSSHRATDVSGYCRRSFTTQTRSSRPTIPFFAKVPLSRRRAIATTTAKMSRHPDFQTVEASRPDWDTSASFRHTKTADPNWTPGGGANHLDPSPATSKKHVAIDPYEPGRPATFNYKLLISGITPRPIGFVSTRSGTAEGEGKGEGEGGEETFNLAPFSYFNVVSTDPPVFALGVSSPLSKPKDTLRHLVANGECTVNIISEHFIEAANATSIDAPTGYSEWAISGLTPIYDCETVRTPRAREAIFSVECKVDSIREFDSRANPGKKSGCMVLLEGLRFWVREDAINAERNAIAPEILRPMSRLGGITYGRTTDVIELQRPVFERDLGVEGYEKLKNKTNGTAE
ncbi:hypothetical protein E0Z10_g7240 [Xylaria hypoxylon]|uniref:Flavin reductase like domain-containing protein n=1 Tax=Xylaria hypoxylon TaxID=37992 RepID=A0A4Z0YYS2_9PEZI|nr:hypothetical protein E0Z10_g7240 [Xylaria hypoxylon]